MRSELETGEQDTSELELASGRFEACAEHRGAGTDGDGPCADCGWLAAEHTAGLAVVLEVRRAPTAPLRRAS